MSGLKLTDAERDRLAHQVLRGEVRQTLADIDALLAAARADERERITAAVRAEREGFLDSVNLSSAWAAGWHAAVDHVAHRLAGPAQDADADSAQ